MPTRKFNAATRPSIASTRRTAVLCLLTGLLAISGCAWNPAHRAEQRAAQIDAIRESAEEEPTIPVPPPVRDALSDETAPETDAPATEPEEALPTIPVRDFDMGREADLAVVLRALARGADINLALGPGVSGSVLVNLPKETTWDQLFRMLVETHGLHYEYKDGLLRVLGPADIERQIALQEALKQREIARDERRRAEPLEFRLYHVRYSDVTQLAGSLRSAFAPVAEEGAAGPRSNGPLALIPDADSGLLIIHAPPSRMPDILELARNLDQPAFQILIEATIVQATSETARQLGMRWGLRHTAPDSGNITIGTSAGGNDFNSNFPAQFDPVETGFTFGLERLSDHQLLQAQLSALQREGRLSIVSSPSITTLDKQTALLESGEERPFQSAAGTGVSATPTVEFKEALLSLEVTPQVIDGNWIKLRIKTTKDDFDDSRAVLIDDTLQVPITTRLASTTLYLTDGQTTVIGGLTTDTETDQIEGIPYLKNLPLLGGLFRSTNLRNSLSDTLIFITPHIISKGVAQNAAFEEEPLP